MASDLAVSLKIGAAAGGALAALGGVRRTLSQLAGATQLVQGKQQALGAAIQKHMGTLAPQTLAALNRDYERLGTTLDKLKLKQERLAARGARGESLAADRAGIRGQALETVAIGAGALLPVKLAIDFESAMADVKKVVDFKTPGGFARLNDDILKLTERLPMAGTELAAIAASGGQLGIAEESLTGFTETVAKMATAFDMGADEAGDSMAKLANVYKIPIDKIGRLGDAINHLSNNSPAKARDIVLGLGRVGGVAKQFGLVETQAAALVNAFVSLGKPPEVAGTAINGMLTKLATADKQPKKFQQALQSMGMTAEGLKTAIGKDAQGALTGFLNSINKLPKEDRLGALVDMFGLEYADDVAVLVGSMDTYAASLAQVGNELDYAGSMENEFQARSATTANNLQLLKNGLTRLGINIGSAVLPALNSLVNELRPLASGFADWAKANPGLLAGTVKLLAGFAALRLSLLGGRYAFSLMASGFNALGTAADVLSGKWWAMRAGLLSARFAPLLSGLAALKGGFISVGAALAATPIGWLIAGVAAVAVAGVLIYKYWEPIKAFVSGFFAGLMMGLAPIREAFAAAFAPMAPLFAKVGEFMQPIIQWFRELLAPVDLAGGAMLATTASGVSFGLMVGDALSALMAPLRWVLEGIGEIPKAFSGGLAGVAALIANFSPLGLFYRAFAGVMSYFGIELPGKFSEFGGLMIGKLVEGIRNAAGAAKDALLSVGSSIKSGLVDGISNTASAATDAVVGVGGSIKSGFRNVLGINSPSRVFMGYGANVSEGAAIGITGSQGLVRKAALGMAAATAVTMAPPTLAEAPAVPAAPLETGAGTFRAPPNLAAAATLPGAGGMAGSGITIHYAPTITVQGGGPGTQEAVQQALQLSRNDLEKMMREVLADQQRRAF